MTRTNQERRLEEDRRKRSSNLRALGESLRRAGACEDIGPLESAAYQCGNRPFSGGGWGYDVTLLTFRVPTLPGGRPAGLHEMLAKLSVSLVARRHEDIVDGDPFSSLAIDFVLTGSVEAHEEPTVSEAAWHFDRHSGGPEELPTASHPLYHVQYGGRKMHLLQLGQTLLCDAPRLMYPPMDAILAVDFVASNFLYDVWSRLRDDVSYVRLVAASYLELWRPWFSFMNQFWSEHDRTNWHRHKRLCPSLPEPTVPSFVTRDGISRSHGQRRKRSNRRK